MLTFTDPSFAPQVLGGEEVSICIFRRKQTKTKKNPKNPNRFLPECRSEWMLLLVVILFSLCAEGRGEARVWFWPREWHDEKGALSLAVTFTLPVSPYHSSCKKLDGIRNWGRRDRIRVMVFFFPPEVVDLGPFLLWAIWDWKFGAGADTVLWIADQRRGLGCAWVL